MSARAGGTRHRVRFGESWATYRCWSGHGHRKTIDQQPGPGVLLLHGGASGSSTWSYLACRLAERGFAVVAPDLLGHGGSPRARAYPLAAYATHLIGFLDHLRLKPYAIVGHSLGAYAAADLARLRPAGLQRLVLEDPPAPPLSSEVAAPLQVPLPQRAKVVLASTIGRRRFAPRAITSAITQLRRSDDLWWRQWSKLSVRTLVVSGGPRSHIPLPRLERLAKRPGTEFAVLDIGHRIHTGLPQDFADLVLRFLGPTR